MNLTMNQKKESDNESIEEFIEDLKETFSLNNKSATNFYDQNKFNKVLTTIDSNKFNHKNKIGKFKFNDINNLINNIKNNTISESDAKKKINKLNEIKHVETKGKSLIDGQKILLKLFDDLIEAILNNSKNKILNEDNNKIVNEDINVNDNDNDNKTMNEDNNKILNEDNNINDDDSESDDDNDDDDNDDHDEQYYQIKEISRNFKKD